MATQYRGRIVVGVDGSEVSLAAVRWAARWAADAGLPLALVNVVPWYAPRPDDAGTIPAWQGPEVVHHLQTSAEIVARRVLQVAADEAADVVGDVGVEPAMIYGNPAGHLVEASHTADLVVVGTQGLSPLKATMMGSVADEVVTYASGPVAAVPAAPGGGAGRDIVVAVDPDDVAEGAVAFALDTARRLGTTLTTVTVDTPPHLYGGGLGMATVVPTAVLNVHNEASIREALAPIAAGYPTVRVEVISEFGDPVSVIAERAAEASLVVVGSRGRGGFQGLLLGSTSRRLLHRSPAPVVVVRQWARATREQPVDA